MSKKGFETHLQLLFNFFLAAFEDVHGNVRVATVLELEGSVTYLEDFVGGQQPHSINQRQIRHEAILTAAHPPIA